MDPILAKVEAPPTATFRTYVVFCCCCIFDLRFIGEQRLKVGILLCFYQDITTGDSDTNQDIQRLKKRPPRMYIIRILSNSNQDMIKNGTYRCGEEFSSIKVGQGKGA